MQWVYVCVSNPKYLQDAAAAFLKAQVLSSHVGAKILQQLVGLCVRVVSRHIFFMEIASSCYPLLGAQFLMLSKNLALSPNFRHSLTTA